jgi:hypothetical protein
MMSRSIYVLTILFCSALLAQEPGWVKQRPTSQLHFIGIGSADKTSSEYKKLAKANAFNDLASEISVSISSELIDVMTEYSGFSEEYARSEIRMSTKDDLEGYKFFDDYNGEDSYSIFYRIEKDYFKRYANNAISSFDTYLESKDEDDVTLDLTLLIPCLEYIYRAAGQDIYHQSSGKNLRLEVPRLIKSSLSNLEIESSKTRYEAYYGRGIDDVIDIQVIDRKNSQPVSDIDMEVRFERGDGEFLSDQYQTDRNGRFKVNVTQINSKEEQQVIKASANLLKFKAEIDKGGYLDNILKGIARANGLEIVINVSEYRKDKVAVLVVGNGLSSNLLSSLSSKFNYEYKNQTDFDILDPREAEKILEREGFNIESCTTYECQVEVGTKLGVDNLVFIKLSYLERAKILNVSTVFSEIYTKRVGETDDLDLPVKKGETPDEVIIQNVPDIVRSFWSKFNPGMLSINSSIPGISVEIIKSDDNNKLPENRTTPFDIELSPGTYSLNFKKIGYVTRTEQLIINKSDKQTFTVELNKKIPLQAFLRSAIIPGSGQIYSSDAQNPSRKSMGKIIRWSLLTGFAVSGYTWYNYDLSNADYQTAKDTYMGEDTLEGINTSKAVAQKKNQVMLDNQKIFQGSLALIGIIWVGNAVDAFVNFPDYGFTFSLETKPIHNPYDINTMQPTLTLSYKF